MSERSRVLDPRSAKRGRSSRRLPAWGWFAGVAAGALLAIVLGAAVTVRVIGADRPQRPRSPRGAERAAAAQAPGSIRLSLPRDLDTAPVGVTLLRLGEVVAAADGTRLEGIPPAKVEALKIPPAVYVVRYLYHDRPVADGVVEVMPGQQAVLRPSGSELAALEYQRGVEAAARGENDVPYFQRVLKLDPGHVNAHLQLAAYALANHQPEQAERHLAAVRKVDPTNADAARVAALLRGMRR